MQFNTLLFWIKLYDVQFPLHTSFFLWDGRHMRFDSAHVRAEQNVPSLEDVWRRRSEGL